MSFILDVVVVCCTLHNLLLGEEPDEVAQFIEVLQREGMAKGLQINCALVREHEADQQNEFLTTNAKSIAIIMYLGIWRNFNTK